MDLRRVPSIQDERQPPSIGDNLAIRHRQKLDSDWADVKNPYTSWRMKRNSIKNDLAKIKPDYTQDELNKIYAAVGLGDSTNPGDFVREDSLYGTLSRAGSKSVNMFESLYDVVHMNYADWNDDMKTVMSVQEQMDDRNLETGLIDSWQKQTSYGQNALTQFLYDVASSAPLMVGVMGAGIAAGAVAGMAGAPVWLAGMLGMGAVDALTEAGFNFADIVSNPAVRKKIEASLGHEMVDADIDAIREETQRILMDEADTSAAQTAIVNFINPLNWHPAVGKLSKLMKVGTGRLGSIKRVGAGTALREGGEEFGQSLLSQYTSKEAQLRAMSKSGVKEEDMPDVGVSGKEAAYEGLIGAFVGGGIGMFSGSRDFSRYKAGAINVDEGGYPVSKKPNEEGFIGAGPLRFETRRMVDEGNPKQLADWIDRLPRRDNPEGDAREADIIEDELNRIRQDEKLLGEKTSVEKQAQRKEYVDQYDEYRKDPELWERQQIPAEQLEAEQKLEEERNAEEEAQQQAIKDEGEEIFNEAQEAAEEVEKNAPISVKKGKTEVIVHPDLQHAVERILTVNANKRTKRQNEILQLAQENPALKYKEIADIIKKRESQDKFIFGDTNKQTTKGTGEKTTGAGTQNIAILKKVSQKIDEKDNRIQSLVDRIAMLESGEQTITPPAPTLVTPKETIQQQTSLNPDDLKLGPAADEIVNTLKSWVGQDKKAKSWDGLEGTEYSTWEKVRGKIYNPLKEVGRPLNDETTRIKGGPNKGQARTEYFISPSIRLAKINELAAQLGITPKQQEIIEDTIIEDTIVADSIEGDQPDQTTYEGSDVEVAPNYGNDGIEATPKYKYSELSQFINKEVMKETGKVASWAYIQPLTKMTVRHKGGEVMARLDTSLKENQRTQPTVLRFMGFNSKNEPYFNRVFERADRSGSTVKGRTNNPKEIIDPAAVSHLLSGLDKTFAGIKDTGKGDKKIKEAYASYQTVVPQEEVVQSDQAKSIIADQDRLATLSLEFDELTNKVAKDRESVGADSKDIARLASIKGLIDLIHGRIEGSKLPDKEAPQIKVKEGGIPTQKEILNANGYAQELINKKQSNLRKLLKKNKDGLPKDEVIRTLDDIEELYGDGQIKMDYDFGVQLDKVKRDGKNVTLLRMRKTTPVSTFSLQYALKTFGWELVNKEMDGIVDNDIEVVVGQNIPVRKIKKYTDPIIVNGKNLTELAQRSRKFLNESLESAMKRRRGEGYAKTSLSEKEKAAYQRAADYELEKLDANKKEENAASFNWKVSARQFFLTKVAQKTPPTKTKTKTGLSTPQAIERVRNEMARISGVTQESINNTRDDEILEFLWSGPGGDTDIGSTPTITSTEMYDPNKKDHINYQVDNVVFKNGKSETIVGKWGKSGYNVIANEVVDSIGSRVDIEPPKAKPEPAPVQPTTETRLDPDKPYTTAELAAIAKQQQRDMEKTLSKIEEVSTPEVVEPQVIEIHAGKITPEELRKALPKSDETKHKSARFNKLIKLPQYQDVTLWDSSLLPEQKAGKESLALTAQIKLDLGEDKPKGTGDLVKLIRRKLQGNLVHQLKIDEDVEELRQTIDDRYWDLLVGAGHTAINNQLTQRGSTPINRGVKSPGSKKKSKKDDVVKTPLVKEGFITSNIASATITNIPTENPKVNDVWLIAPEEANELFGQRSEGKDMEELTNFLDNNINNGDFFVVKKTGKWSDAYILLRDDFGAPVKGKGADKISVPATIKKRLSREGKFFNTEKPSDQRSKKLTGMEMKDLEGNVSSELFMQLFKTSPVDLNMLQDAYEDNRIVYAFNSGIDNQVEVYWRNEDGSTSTNDIDNAAIMLFNDNSMIGDFIDDIASKKPGNFRKADEHYRHLRDSERSTGDVVSEVFADAAVLSSGKGGIANTNDGLESAEIPLIGESLDTINQEVTEDIYGIAYDPEVATQIALDNEATANLSKEDLIARRDADKARKELSDLKEAYNNGETLEYSVPKKPGRQTPLLRERVEEIISEYQKEFPGSAPVTVLSNSEVAKLLGTEPEGEVVKGMYWNGKVWIVPSNIISEEEALTVLWHENVGHLGVENMMDTHHDGGFDAFVSEIIRDFPKEIRAMKEWDVDLQAKREEPGPGWVNARINEKVAVQEFIAHHADNLFKDSPPGLFQKIARIIRRILRKLSNRFGIGHVRKSEEEIKDILRGVADSFRTGDSARKGTFLATELLHSNLIKVLEKGKNLPKEATIENWNKHLVRLNKSGVINDVEWEFSGITDVLDETAAIGSEREASLTNANGIVTRSQLIDALKDHIELSYPYRISLSDEYVGVEPATAILNERTQDPEVKRIHDKTIRITNDWLAKYHNPNVDEEGVVLQENDPDYDQDEVYKLELDREELLDEAWQVMRNIPGQDKRKDGEFNYTFSIRNKYQEAEGKPKDESRDAFVEEEVPPEFDMGGEEIVLQEEAAKKYWRDGNFKKKFSLVFGKSKDLGSIVEQIMRELRIAKWQQDNILPDGNIDVAAFEHFMEEMLEGYDGETGEGFGLMEGPGGADIGSNWNDLNEVEQVLIDNLDDAFGLNWTSTAEEIQTAPSKIPVPMGEFTSAFPKTIEYEQKSYNIPVLLGTQKGQEEPYKTPHLRVTGGFMHTRTGIVSNEEGEKIKLLGEVQSELHQGEHEAKKWREERKKAGKYGGKSLTEREEFASRSPFSKTWHKKAVLFELQHALRDPTIDYLAIPTGKIAKVFTHGKLSGQIQWYEKVLPKALSDLIKPLGVEVEKISIPLELHDVSGQRDVVEKTYEVDAVDLRKIRAKGDIQSQPLFFKTRRPNPTSFNNANLPESARESWDKLYTRETNETTGSWWKDIRQRLVTRVFDPYSIIRDEIGTTEYMNTRLAGRSDGMLATILNYSGIKVAKRSIGNVVINETLVDPKIKGLFSTLKPLGTPTERQQFFGWITFNRADKLYKEGKESGFTRQQIDEGLQYNKGRIKNASTGVVVSREQLYEDIRKKVMQMNSSIVKIGIDMGLFNKEVSNNFESEFYVPFYRLIEEEIGDNNRGGFTGNYSGLTGQQGVKKLKGSNRPIGDPFNNLLFNWLHIMDASIKNDAANTTINSALSIRNPMDSSQMLVEPTNTNSSNTIRVKQNGVEKKYNINNQLLYNSMTALSSETKFPGLKYAIGAKGLFTKIITSFPGFKATNYFKDTITAAGTSDIGFNLVGNAIGGFRSIKDLHADMLVSGGYIQFAYTRSDDPKYAETLLNKELKSGYILNNPESDNTFLSALKKANHMRRGLLDKYAKFGDKLENANRAALFKNLIAEGKSQTEAAFEARDLMDFTLHGGADWVKLVTSLTPFANAILQGKYKLARQIKNNPKPVAAVSGLVLMASLFEQMYYENDEEYQARPDWDKDTYWWIPLPGTDTNFKLPKPHEFSIIGNMAWRALKMSKEENPEYGEALMSGVKSIVSREFGIVPLPQIMKPFIEVGMNRNLFFDRDIEPMGSRGLSPSKRYGQFTSETAILASEILEKMPLDKLKLSPYQLQHLIEGYFGWIGSYTLATADMITRNAGNFPERPARKLMDYQLARRFFKSSPLRNTKYGTIFYERLKDIEQTVQDMELARKLGHMDEYLEIYEEKKDILMYKNFIKKKTRMINDLNARIKEIRYSIDMGGEEKSVRMDRLYQLRNQLMRHVVETAKLR